MVSEIKSQGIIPVINQGAKGSPLSIFPIFNPNVKASQIINIDIVGWIKAQGRPMYEARYFC